MPAKKLPKKLDDFDFSKFVVSTQPADAFVQEGWKVNIPEKAESEPRSEYHNGNLYIPRPEYKGQKWRLWVAILCYFGIALMLGVCVTLSLLTFGTDASIGWLVVAGLCMIPGFFLGNAGTILLGEYKHGVTVIAVD